MKFSVESFKISFIALVGMMLIATYSFGQRYNTIFNPSLSRAQLKFKMPQGFSELDSTSVFKCFDHKTVPGSIIYTITNRDSSVVIGFVNIMGVNNTTYDPKQNVEGAMEYDADKSKSAAKKYDLAYLNDRFGADIGGEYSRACGEPFLKKYTKNRFVIIGKSGVGEATMIYFFQDKNPDINKVIAETAGMLKFVAK